MRAAGSVRRLTLDAGALVAYERNDRSVREMLHEALVAGVRVTVPAGVLAQVWRDGRRQARLGYLLQQDGVTIVDLDEPAAKASGELCGLTDTRDVIDASVVVCARSERSTVITSDPSDIGRLDPRLELKAV